MRWKGGRYVLSDLHHRSSCRQQLNQHVILKQAQRKDRRTGASAHGIPVLMKVYHDYYQRLICSNLQSASDKHTCSTSRSPEQIRLGTARVMGPVKRCETYVGNIVKKRSYLLYPCSSRKLFLDVAELLREAVGRSYYPAPFLLAPTAVHNCRRVVQPTFLSARQTFGSSPSSIRDFQAFRNLLED